MSSRRRFGHPYRFPFLEHVHHKPPTMHIRQASQTDLCADVLLALEDGCLLVVEPTPHALDRVPDVRNVVPRVRARPAVDQDSRQLVDRRGVLVAVVVA
jgi:hypothetical protein